MNPPPPLTRYAYACALLPMFTMPMNVVVAVAVALLAGQLPVRLKMAAVLTSFAAPGILGVVLGVATLVRLRAANGTRRGYWFAIPCFIWGVAWVITSGLWAAYTVVVLGR